MELNVDVEAFIPIENTNQIRRFVGKIVQRIAKAAFSSIQKDTDRLNIYTDELRAESKALKVFYGDRLDFIDEERKKKEIILWLMNPQTRGSHIDLVRSFGSLDLDPALAPYYIEALLEESRLPFVEERIDELYTGLEDVGERLSRVDSIDKELYFDRETHDFS